MDQVIPRTRPRNRRDMIITSASELFARRGYANVSMSDIARSVAIGPSALYRHFASKEDLLFEVVQRPIIELEPRLDPSDEASISEWAASLAEWALANRALGTLWQRESRHLPPDRRNELRGALIIVQRIVLDAVSRHRPELSQDQADLLTWAVMDTLMSVSFQRVELPHTEYLRLLVDITTGVIMTPLPDPPATASAPVADQGPRDTEGSTADRLVSAAARLFAQSSYESVGINDVAAEVGIAGPSIYHHFGTKLDLLAAAMGDAADRLLSVHDRILDGGGSARSLLDRLLESYVDFTFANTNVIDVIISETINLDEEGRRTAREQQMRYIRTWITLLESIRPDLPPGHARVRVQAALTLTNDVARTAHLRRQPGARSAVIAIAGTVLR